MDKKDEVGAAIIKRPSHLSVVPDHDRANRQLRELLRVKEQELKGMNLDARRGFINIVIQGSVDAFSKFRGKCL